MRPSSVRTKFARLLTREEMQPFVDQWAESHDPAVPAIFADNMQEEGDPRHELLRSHGMAAHHGLSPLAKVEADLGLTPGDINESRKTGRNLLPFGWVHSTQLFGSDGTGYNIHIREHQGQPRVKVVAKLSPSKGSPLSASKNFWMDDAKAFADRMGDHDPNLGYQMHAALEQAHGEFLNQQHAQAGDQQAHAMNRGGDKAKFARVEAADVHPDYQPTGIAPRIGHALGRIAAEGEDIHGPNHAALAEAILRTGDHSVLPILADALEENGHPLYHEFDWRHAPRAIEIDRQLFGTIQSLPGVRHADGFRHDVTPGWILSDWQDGARTRLSKKKALNSVRKVAPDATFHDVAHSLVRLMSHTGGRQHEAPVPDWQTAHESTILQRLGAIPLNPHRYPDTRPQPKQRKAKKNSRVKMGRLQEIPTARERQEYLNHLDEQADRQLATLTPAQRAERMWSRYQGSNQKDMLRGDRSTQLSILRDEFEEADDHRTPIVEARLAATRAADFITHGSWSERQDRNPQSIYDRALVRTQTGADDRFVHHHYAEKPNSKRRASVSFGLYHSPHDGTPMALVEHSDSHGSIDAHMTADQAMEVARRLPHSNDAEFQSTEAVRKALTDHAATRERSRLQREAKKMSMRSFEEYRPFLGVMQQKGEGVYLADRQEKTGPAPDLILADFMDEADDPRGDIIRASVGRGMGHQKHIDSHHAIDNAHLGEPVKHDWLTTYTPHRMADGSRLSAGHFTPLRGPMQGVPHVHVDWYHPEYQDSSSYSGYMTPEQMHDFASRIEGDDPATANAVRKMLTEGNRVHLSNSAMGKVPPVLHKKKRVGKPVKMAASGEEPPTNLANAVMDPPTSSSSNTRLLAGNKAGRFRTPEEHASHLEAVAQHLESRGDHRAPIAQAQLDRVKSPSSRWTNLDRFISREKPEAVTHEFGRRPGGQGIGGKVSFHLYHSPFGGTPMVWTRHDDGFGTTAAHLTPMQAMAVARKMPASTPQERASAEAVAAKVAEHAYSRPQKLTKQGRPHKMKADMKTGLAQALTRLHSRNEKAFQETLADVLNKTNLKPHKIYQVLHDTPSNVKPSVAASIMKQVEDSQAEYAAAYHGLLTNQLSVLLFKSHPEGNDSIYRMRVPGKPEQIRGLLDKTGVHSRLLVPKSTHTEVILHDPERKMRGKVAGLADKLGVGVEEVTGTGTVLGGRDAEAARAKYRDVVRGFESGGKAKMSKKPVKMSKQDVETLIDSLEPEDHVDLTPRRLILSDALEEEGRLDEAKRLREHRHFQVLHWPYKAITGAYSEHQEGYPLIHHTADGGTLCADCANGDNGSEAGRFDTEYDPQWHVVGSHTHLEGPPEQCDHCGKQIESAYGDPNAEDE
jgi:hypothetical protein